MLRRFHDISLKHQLTTVIVVTCTVVLLVACAALATYELVNYRRGMVADMTVLADVVGANTQAAIAFRDEDAAAELLKGLAAASSVVAGRIYDQEGVPFVDYRRSAPSPVIALPDQPLALGEHSLDGYVAIVRPITRAGKVLGTLHLQISLQGFKERIRLLAIITAGVLILSMLVATLLSTALQQLISGPILRLASLAKRIAEQRDHHLRAPGAGTNEVGTLTNAFNEMLDRIAEQNQVLHEEEGRIRAVLNAALSAVVVVDEQGRITDWTLRAEAVFGWARDEVVGRLLTETILPERLRRQGLTGFGPTPDARATHHISETTCIRKDHGEFLAELSVRTLRTQGSSASYCGFITDITERKAAEIRLREQMVRMDLLNRITHAISTRQDLPSIFQVVIRSLEHDLPVDVGAVYHLDDQKQVLTMSNVGANGEFLTADGEVRAQDISISDNHLTKCLAGELIYEPDLGRVDAPLAKRLVAAGYTSFVATPLVVESRVVAVLIVARSAGKGFSSAECEFLRQLSDHVALAAHQAQLHTALQQAYDELRQTQHAVMQQERLRALGQMASGIAHDINNAISPVGLYTEMLLHREQHLSERGRQQLETINRAIDDVAHTVKRLGEFYRQREAQTQLTPVDANEMVKQILDLTRAKWSDLPQQRGIMIQTRLDLGMDLPPLMAVASEVREALTNLVFNAVDAMPEGGTLTVRTRVIDAAISPVSGGDSRFVAIEVVDTGTGMNEETRKRCLEPFFTTKGERGTGLGLAMVYGILQRHQADIEIDSSPGQGTTMRLRFPIRSPQHGQPAVAGLLMPSSPLRILLVDDDPLILRSLRDALEADGHLVETANGGRAGIDAFKAAGQAGLQPAVVVTDLGMPYVDGRQVAAAIKGISPSTPVILLTGWGQRLIAEGDIPPHVDCVLSKPPKLHEVRSTLARLCTPSPHHDGVVRKG